jgi:hypothetical protein
VFTSEKTMIRTYGLAIGLGALALSACNQPTTGSTTPDPQAQMAATDPAVPPPQFTDMPATGCLAPTPGTMTIRRGETAAHGSMQIYYRGRDETYRTEPYVYMFESNAPLRNHNNTQREAHFFGLWRGEIQTAEPCGRTVHMTLVRANADAATISIRP